ncbi:MAG: hypothetical protein ABI680_17540 [Chthoniobacteraceae bacterium]
MPASDSTYPLFSGRVRHALDAKNRTTIPAGWRPARPAPLWLVPQSDGSCLLAMPYEEFKAIPARVNSLTHIDAEDRQNFIDLIYAEAEQVTPDKQGRFVIPEHFCRELTLSGEIILTGAESKLKIWNPEAFEAFRSRRRTETRNVGKLAQL